MSAASENKPLSLLVWNSWVRGTGTGVLYSTASHCCFQQTVHHYSVWQESKHWAFTGQDKASPLSSPLSASLSSPSSSRILTLLLGLLPRFHTSLSSPALVFWTRSPAASRGEESRLTLGATRVFLLFSERDQWRRAVYYLLMKRLKKRRYFIRSCGTWITHLRCVSSGFFGDFLRTNEQGDSPL